MSKQMKIKHTSETPAIKRKQNWSWVSFSQGEFYHFYIVLLLLLL